MSNLPPELQLAVNSDPEFASEYSIGITTWEAADWPKSVVVWEQIYAHSIDKNGTNHITTDLAAFYLGDSYRRVQKSWQALPLLTKAAEASAKLLRPEHIYTANVLDSLAATYQSTGQLDKALPTAMKGLRIKELLKGNDSDEFAISSIYVASILFSLDRFDEALAYQRGAFRIWRDIYGRNHPKPVLAMNEIAQSQFALGLYKEALETQQLALRISMRLGPDQYDANLIGLSNIASTHEVMGDFSTAIATHKTALDLTLKKFGTDHPRTAGIMSNLAVSYFEIGNYPLAESYFEDAIRIEEKFYGKDSVQVASTLENLAEVQLERGQLKESLASSERAIRIYQDRLGGSSLRAFEAMKRHANFLRSAGRLNDAKVVQELALSVTIERWGEDHIETARAKGNLGITLSILGDHQAAYPLKLEALRIFESTFGHSNKEVAVALANLASDVEVLYGENASIAIRKRAVNILQLSRQNVAKIGTNELQMYTKRLENLYQSLASLLIDQGRLTEAQQVLDMLKEDEQFEFVRRSSDADPRRSGLGYNPMEQKWMDRYRQISDRLASLGVEERELAKQAKIGLSPVQQKRQKSLHEDLVVARSAYSSFMGEMREGFAAKGPARAVEVSETSEKTAGELQVLIRSLGDGVALLQYYVTDDRVGMLLTTPGVQLARSFKLSGKELNRQIAEFRRALRDPKVDPLPMAQALYGVLIGPVEGDLVQTGAKTVMLSLDGALRYLPFGALHDGHQYVVQRWSLPIYTSVMREKLRDINNPRWQAAGLGVTRAMGEFSALPAVRSEMGSIVKTGNNAGVLPGDIYLDEAFSAQRLKDVGQRKYELLHVASHFRFSPGTESNSFLLLGDGQQLTLGDIRTQNYRFDNVDLLTLSACDTGLGGGRDEKGKEIEGFGVIAQQQGAKAVLATLWPVADQSTSDLMVDMYRRRQAQGLSKIEALRQAQVGLMRRPMYAHPFYWAPFILMGNWK